MFGFGKKKDDSEQMAWDDQARQALDQAVAQAPVPAMLRGRMRAELEKAGEEHARKHGHTSVTAQDLMEGLLSKLPESMRSKIEDAAKKGPAGLADLQKELGDKK
jgi:hypothetical protein